MMSILVQMTWKMIPVMDVKGPMNPIIKSGKVSYLITDLGQGLFFSLAFIFFLLIIVLLWLYYKSVVY